MPHKPFDINLCQRTINERCGTRLKPDGNAGPATLKAVAEYQAKFKLAVTGQLDDGTTAHMLEYAKTRFVSPDDVAAAAKEFKIEPSMLLAFWQVESSGAGFIEDGRTTVLFERHVFYRYVKERLGEKVAEEWRKKYPDLCHPVWDASFYSKAFGGEWERLTKACQLDGTCGLLAASWGLFQLMGYNFAMGGYKDVQTLVGDFAKHEKYQLAAICKFIVAQKALMDAIKASNFDEVARIYNGPGYAKNNYHVKLKDAKTYWKGLGY